MRKLDRRGGCKPKMAGNGQQVSEITEEVTSDSVSKKNYASSTCAPANLKRKFDQLVGQKKCGSCGQLCPSAVKKCPADGCTFIFDKKRKDWEKIKNKKKTNPTDQKDILEYRADVLHIHHEYDVVIFYKKKHKNGVSISCYGTPGIGEYFVRKAAEGKMARDLFEAFVRSKESIAKVPHQEETSTLLTVSTCSKQASSSTSSIKSTLPNPSSPFNTQASTLGPPTASLSSSIKSILPNPPSSSNTQASTLAKQTTSLSSSAIKSTLPNPSSSFNTQASTLGPPTASLSSSSIKSILPNPPSSSNTQASTLVTQTASLSSSAIKSTLPNPSSSFNTQASTLGPPTASLSSSSINSTLPFPSSSSNTQSSTQAAPSVSLSSSIKSALPNPASSSNLKASILAPPTSVSSLSLASITLPSDHTAGADAVRLVAFLGDGEKPVACGWEQPSRTRLHGHNIPPGHVCVQLTKSVPCFPAPVILGDPDENAFLQSGGFFALPIDKLRIPLIVNGVVKLHMYSVKC